MHLFDHEVKKEKPEILKLVGKPYKFLPKEYSSATAIDIFGDYVVTNIMSGTYMSFLIKNKFVADYYLQYFENAWKAAKP